MTVKLCLNKLWLEGLPYLIANEVGCNDVEWKQVDIVEHVQHYEVGGGRQIFHVIKLLRTTIASRHQPRQTTHAA